LNNGSSYFLSSEIPVIDHVLSREEVHLAPFRLIQDDTIGSYRGPLVGVVAMLMRLCWHKQGKLHTKERDLAEKLLKATDRSQLEASIRLCKVILTLKGKQHKTISTALGQLLEAILCPQDIGCDHIACPTELYIFASFWTAHGHRTAQSVVSKCCKMQFCLRIIHILQVKNDIYEAKAILSSSQQKEELKTPSTIDGDFCSHVYLSHIIDYLRNRRGNRTRRL
jgi:hypothetical protein